MKRGKRECSHLGARNTCPDDSKELGSSDCISVTKEREREEVIHVASSHLLHVLLLHIKTET